MDSKLVNLLKSSATMLVPSRRLSTSLRATANHIFAQSHKTWDTPRIYALEDWLGALWDQFEISGLVTKLLISATQSLLKLEEIITCSQSGKGLLRQQEAAKKALEAWHHLHYWLALDVLRETPENSDQGAFQEWATTYYQWLEENHFIDRSQLPQVLLPWLLEEKYHPIINLISPGSTLILYGFEELPPLYKHFFQSLAHHRWQVEYQEATKVTPQKIARAAFLQQDQEWVAAANWAKALIEAGEKNIAIVAPNLADIRSQLEVIFKDTFATFHLLNPSLQVCPHFNISAAIPLIQYPLILEAMNFLKLGSNINLSEMMTCFTSPFFYAYEEEKFARIQLKQALQGDCKLSLSEILKGIDKHDDILVPKLRERLLKLTNLFADVRPMQHFSQWAQIFRNILSLIGWPGDRVLNSVEYQLVKRLDALLDELGLCDAVYPQASYAPALNTLQKLAANIPFQPENKGASIQILGLLEAAGSTYDHVWLMGMHSEAWPPPPMPNPFLPIELQRQLKMPHAGAQRELEYAQKITQRFKQSAQEIIFSYATKDKEKTLTASELIQDIPLLCTPLTCERNRCENYFSSSDVEEIADDKAPILNDPRPQGSNTLALQAACPFKAFAQIRLQLNQPQNQNKWLQAQQQGIVIHQILAEFWDKVRTQSALLKLPENELFNLINQLIEKQLKKHLPKEAPYPYIDVEKTRLNNLLHTYLALEKQREPFKVSYIEQPQSYQLADLNFSIRIDRIDETIAGETILIDYKTGKFDLSLLWGDRLAQVQLPLYFLANQDLNLKTLMVIKLSTDETAYEGLSENPTMPGIISLQQINDSEIPKTWAGLNEYWYEKLIQLAQDFKQGKAAVDPLHPQVTCKYCHLKSLCRIQERQA